MPDKCAHVLGLLHGEDVTEIDCQAVRIFVEDVREFNTSHKVLPHPGWLNLALYCHKCGAQMDREKNNIELNKLVESLGGWG
ncbi:TPA: hypothetical protein ACGSTL_001431 [Vibrio parahaemolyticus]|uniref:hypothetical protein n=1 Tax=Vibrio campbellii TaxID=680 RepID=UPI001F075E53|nr:hypothetical protein [Vibrio campbellii]UMM06876.1 hypothetical protein MKR81_26815 [Vibrio campbellii]